MTRRELFAEVSSTPASLALLLAALMVSAAANAQSLSRDDVDERFTRRHGDRPTGL